MKVNNVVYNWGTWGFAMADYDENLEINKGARVNAISNSFQSGDDTDNKRFPIVIGDTDKYLYVRDNKWNEPDHIIQSRSGNPNWRLVGDGVDNASASKPAPASRQRLFQWPTSTPVGILPTKDVEKLVMNSVGANRPSRDSVEDRLISETRSGFSGNLCGRIPNCVGPNDNTTPSDCKDLNEQTEDIILCCELAGAPDNCENLLGIKRTDDVRCCDLHDCGVNVRGWQ